jgi:DNA-binding SARP family transcriptional activator
MEVGMLGVLTLRHGDRRIRTSDLGGAKPRAVLELLLLARGHTVTKDYLADALWQSAAPKGASATVEVYICVLRHRLFEDQAHARRAIVTGPNSYRLDLDHVTVDLDRFDALLFGAEGAAPSQRRRLLTDAVALIRGDVLEDAPYAPWAHSERLVYRERIARAHLVLARDCLADRDLSAALRHGDAALRFAPFSEQAFRVLMVANYAMGHDDIARATFSRCRTLLGETLGVDPTTETMSTAQAIDAGAPANEVITEVTMSPTARR